MALKASHFQFLLFVSVHAFVQQRAVRYKKYISARSPSKMLQYFKILELICVCARVCVGKSQVMGEIKIALKKEVKTEGDHLILEILQCRNITYKFKSPDHLPGSCSFTLSHSCHRT